MVTDGELHVGDMIRIEINYVANSGDPRCEHDWVRYVSHPRGGDTYLMPDPERLVAWLMCRKCPARRRAGDWDT